MITITKERNNIKIEVSGTSGCYLFDINSGIFYGKKGSPIKTLPLPMYDFRRALLNTNENKNLYSIISEMIVSEGTQTAYYRKDRWRNMYGIAEKIDGMGVPFINVNTSYLESINANFEQFVKYVNEAKANNVTMTHEWARDFRYYLEYLSAKDECGKYHEYITPKMYYAVKHNCPITLTEEIWGVIAYYLVKQKVWEYSGNSARTVMEYLTWCEYMEKKPEKTASFTREYIETQRTYFLKKTEYDNKRMSDHFAKHSKAFEFAYGNYMVVIPKTAQDIVDEGANMHHCVGGYAPDVVAGKQYIIFIRHKDIPDKCYITCQVYNNGTVGQYFLAYDNYISSNEDKEFYNALVKHIRENW